MDGFFIFLLGFLREKKERLFEIIKFWLRDSGCVVVLCSSKWHL